MWRPAITNRPSVHRGPKWQQSLGFEWTVGSPDCFYRVHTSATTWLLLLRSRETTGEILCENLSAEGGRAADVAFDTLKATQSDYSPANVLTMVSKTVWMGSCKNTKPASSGSFSGESHLKLSIDFTQVIFIIPRLKKYLCTLRVTGPQESVKTTDFNILGIYLHWKLRQKTDSAVGGSC